MTLDLRILKRLFNNDGGTSILEFALMLPILITLIFGTLQLGFVMVALNGLDAAAREASRYGITGGTESGKTREDSIVGVIHQTITDYTGGLVDPSKVKITVESFPNLSSLGDVSLGTLDSFGVGGEVVLYKLEYDWNTGFPIFGTSSTVPLTAQTAVVNEQF